MRQATVVEPTGLMSELAALLPSTGTIRAPGGVLTPGTEGSFANVSGFVDIACAVAPAARGQRADGDFIVTDHEYVAVLDDRYASLHSATVSLQFVTGGITYGAVVDGDSHAAYTRLKLTKINA